MGKSKKGKKGGQGLSGVEGGQAGKHSYKKTGIEAFFSLLAAVGASGAGAVIGKHSLVAGLPIFVYGVHKQNPYIKAAGLGLILANGFQLKKQQPPTTQGIGALDMKQMAEEAKDRVTTFFKNFSEKLYLSKSTDESTSGLGDDQVTYFVNPYSNKELDMSAIDRIQEQIAEMNKGTGTSGLNEVDREF